MTNSTGRESDKFMLRLPDGMRDRLKNEAARNNRSLNAEIIARLEQSFEAGVVRTMSDEDLNETIHTAVNETVDVVVDLVVNQVAQKVIKSAVETAVAKTADIMIADLMSKAIADYLATSGATPEELKEVLIEAKGGIAGHKDTSLQEKGGTGAGAGVGRSVSGLRDMRTYRIVH